MNIVISLLLLATSITVAADVPRPNIILILADDLGFSDVGCYGGEIATPNLDRLAAGGLRLTRFYNSGKCEPTRASLMSGQYWQDTGLGVKKGPTLAEAMKPAGYDTFAIGKWHLDGNPVDRGFDHFFGHLSGATDYFKGDRSHRLDRAIYQPPADGTFYTTDANADHAIRFIDDAHRAEPAKPFFLYLAFNAPHAPIQAPAAEVAKYRGKYRIGWDRVREQRYRRQLELGIMKPGWKLAPRPATIPAWDTLTDAEKDFEDGRMAVYAAMVDRMDQAIGRVLAKVRELGEEDRTLVIFTSDNGASPYDHQRDRKSTWETARWEYGLGWANACNTPFAHYKRNMFNGGNCPPCIVSWPGVLKKPGSLVDQPTHIVDFMATFTDVSGKPSPATAGFPGISLVPIITGERQEKSRILYFHLFDHRAVMDGDLKLVSDWGRPWELFNLAEDRTELHDLAETQADQAARLAKLWQDWAGQRPLTKLQAIGGEPIYRHRADVGERFVGDRHSKKPGK